MTAQLASFASVRIDMDPQPRPADATIVVAEYPLNRNQAIRAEIIQREGRSIVSLSRWKNTPAGHKRTGQAFEFGAHRASDVIALLAEVLGALDAQERGRV